MILFAHLRVVLSLPTDALIPRILRGGGTRSSPTMDNLPPATLDGKRKAPDDDGPTAPESNSEFAKRPKQDVPPLSTAHARAVAAHIPFLSVESLLPRKMPTKEDMEGVLLELRKRALVESILEISSLFFSILSESLRCRAAIAITCRAWLFLSIIQQSSIKSNI